MGVSIFKKKDVNLVIVYRECVVAIGRGTADNLKQRSN